MGAINSNRPSLTCRVRHSVSSSGQISSTGGSAAASITGNNIAQTAIIEMRFAVITFMININ
jgi:hypothetical protein